MPTVIDANSGLVIVDQPLQAPGMCMATLTSEDYEGFIDTGNVVPVMDPHVYISVSWVKEVARKFGMEDGFVNLDLRAQVEELTEKLIIAERAVAAVEVLKSSGYVAEVKKGRPAKTKTEIANDAKADE